MVDNELFQPPRNWGRFNWLLRCGEFCFWVALTAYALCVCVPMFLITGNASWLE